MKTNIVCLLLLSIVSVALAKPPGGDGLVLHFRTVPLPAPKVKDLSGQKNDGKALFLTVSNSPSLVSMQQTHQLTISLWIKPNSIPSVFPILVCKGGNSPPGAYGGYELTLNANGDHDLVFTSGAFAAVTGGNWINNHLGEWTHVAFTIDASGGTIQFYVNGQPTGDTAVYAGSTSDVDFDLPNNLYIGTPDPASDANRAGFDGQIREVRLFNRALSATEILNIFSTTRQQ